MRYSTSGEQNIETSLDFVHQLLFTNIHRPPSSSECAVLSSQCSVYPTYRRWLPFLFGWRLAVVVTGLLAATDPFSPFSVFGLPLCLV